MQYEDPDKDEIAKYLAQKFQSPGVDMAAAQEQAREQALIAGMGRAGNTIGAAMSGTKADQSFYDDMAAGAGDPVKEAQSAEARKMEIAQWLQKRNELSEDKAYRHGRDEISDQQHAETMGRQSNRDKVSDSQFNQRLNLDAEKLKQAAAEKEAERLRKEEEKANKVDKKSPVEVQKAGLYSIGRKAEDQYNAAVAGGKKSGDWDPTSLVEVMDNDFDGGNWTKDQSAIEAHAAAGSWIDSFLRDESGAAIPEDERAKYYKIYFPQGGDSPQTVANKVALRRQKMSNAAIAARVDDQGYGPQEVGAPGEALAGEKLVKIQAPDGSVRSVPAGSVEKYVSKGGKVIE